MRVFDGCVIGCVLPPFMYTQRLKRIVKHGWHKSTHIGQLCATTEQRGVCVTFHVHTNSQINTLDFLEHHYLLIYVCMSLYCLNLNVFYFYNWGSISLSIGGSAMRVVSHLVNRPGRRRAGYAKPTFISPPNVTYLHYFSFFRYIINSTELNHKGIS